MTYNSPRTSRDSNRNELYVFLQNSETLETDKITAELLLTQDDAELRVKKESASLHIREDIDGLKVYVLGDKRSQEVCFNSKLPRRLCEWIMTDPATQIVAPVSPDAVAVVQSVLSAQPFAINDILDEHGIVEVNIADSPGLATSLSSSIASPGVIPSVDVAVRSSHEASSPQLRPMDANGVVEGDPHLSLLRSVIDTPRRTTFLSRGAFDMSAVNAALPRGSGDNDAATESLPTKVDQPDRA